MGPWLRSHGRAEDRGTFRRHIAPLQWGRGFAATEGEPMALDRWLAFRFNGAVASQPRKVRYRRAGIFIPKLQWGRGFAATEGGVVPGPPAVFRPASMGPWLRSHGRTCAEGAAKYGDWLQWGRGFAATEGLTSGASAKVAVLLQWGRGFAATEGEEGWPGSHHRRCFNGAVASQPRKATTEATHGTDGEGLQWGRGFAATEGPHRRVV